MQVKTMIDQKLIKQTLDYVNYLVDARIKQISPNQLTRYSERCDLAAPAFRSAFEHGGLLAVDELIESLNEALKNEGAELGFREGCGLETQEGRPPYLIIILVNFSSDRAIAQDAIRL